MVELSWPLLPLTPAKDFDIGVSLMMAAKLAVKGSSRFNVASTRPLLTSLWKSKLFLEWLYWCIRCTLFFFLYICIYIYVFYRKHLIIYICLHRYVKPMTLWPSKASMWKVSGSSPRDVAKQLRDNSMVFKGAVEWTFLEGDKRFMSKTWTLE